MGVSHPKIAQVVGETLTRRGTRAHVEAGFDGFSPSASVPIVKSLRQKLEVKIRMVFSASSQTGCENYFSASFIIN